MAARTRTSVLERGVDGSVVTLSVIPGGLRVITESVPTARSASVGIWVGVGSVDETTKLAGASHYLEHLLFKGTSHRTGHEIAAAIDAVGGELNAFTSHEYTCYYAHVLASSAELAVDIVCDVVLDAVISSPDVDVERQVILEEISMRDDDPEDTLGDAFAAAMFAGHPVAAPVIGSEQSIIDMTRTQIAGYYRRRYSPEKMVVSVAGGVDHADVVKWVRRAFGSRLDPARTADLPRVGRGTARALSGALVVERDIEQAHLSIGVPSGGRNDPDRYATSVLAAALGGGMSSRLFRTIREEHGLAYSCYAATSGYADVGSFSVYAGCQPENLGTVSKLIGLELAAVAERGLETAELARVHGQLAGGMILGLEDTESKMSRIGKNLLVRNEYRSVSDELEAIARVDADQVSALAARLLTQPMTAAVVGPYAAETDLPEQLTSLVQTGGQRRHVG
ncbi:Predicted Zn-dependent peptidase [Nakamurella panacisegetis]|uniref:Predicted Zn-dependent peptidase n=1 Tax=Nakamurella panacisegetis TaxID=1090615 RepID=A0A1H0SIR7_9ACTN|nr:pitrilysin family protein [Nakamurella panacisegetis]SDP41712.1 Predicted Zn-dependent peptidase [Nakamurella panacisegetis]